MIAINTARTACPTTPFVLVADAEADSSDLLVAERPAGVDLLIRAGQNRRVRHPDARRLWDALPGGIRVGTRTVRVAARDGKPGRAAHVTIRRQEVCIQPPQHRATEALAPVTLWAVWVVEDHPPAGAEAIEWLLLTSVPVRTNAWALTILDW